MIRQFTILGGGSAYTPGLLQALIHHQASLGLERVRLYDTQRDHLELVRRLGEAMARSAGARFTVETASDLSSALKGAELVLNSTRPGGFRARRLDETLPLALGIPGQETVGPGGFFFALRSVPEALRLAEAMEISAPGARLLNYTNPSNIVTQALVDRGGVSVVGLCDQSEEDLHDLAQALHREGEPCAFRCNGLNHATWYSDLRFGSEPFQGARFELQAPEGLDAEHRLRFALSQDMARQTPAYWPNSYLPYYLAPERFVELSLAQGPRTDAILPALPRYYDHFREEAAKEHPQLRLHRGSSGFGDLAVATLKALVADESVPLVLNVENRGITDLFAPSTVVEAQVRLGNQGVERLSAPGIPSGHSDLLLRLERYQRLAAEAASTGGETAILKALEANPLVETKAKAIALWDLARDQYGSLLPALA